MSRVQAFFGNVARAYSAVLETTCAALCDVWIKRTFINFVGLWRLDLSVVVAADLAGGTGQRHQQWRVDVRRSFCILLECRKGLAFCLLAELLRWLERGEFFDCGALFD